MGPAKALRLTHGVCVVVMQVLKVLHACANCSLCGTLGSTAVVETSRRPCCGHTPHSRSHAVITAEASLTILISDMASG